MTVFATFLRVACSSRGLTVRELSTATGVGPPPHAERKMSKEHAATNLSILIPMVYIL